MKYLMISLAFLFSLNLTAQEYQYVWAPSGLNMRSAPSIDSGIVGTLAFGDSVIVIAETNVSYNIKAITKCVKDYNAVKAGDPFILYGQWVLVMDNYGRQGYIVDQYIHSLRTQDSPFIYKNHTVYDTISVDYIYYSYKAHKKIFKNGINSVQYMNDKGYQETFCFPGFSIQDVYIIFASTHNGLPHEVYQNWKNHLKFNDGENCDIEIILDQNVTKLIIGCYC